MADLNAIETGQAQDVTTQLRQQITDIRSLRNNLTGLLENWEVLKAFHTPDEINAALSGENSGLSYAMIESGFAALRAMGDALDDPARPERRLAIIQLSHAHLK